MHAKYDLDLQGLRSHKMLSLLISDFITSVHHMFMYEEYREFKDFRIVIDFKESILF